MMMNLDGKKKRKEGGARHCGFVVSDLSSVGAGASEGWIQDPRLLLSMSMSMPMPHRHRHAHAHLLSFAKGAHALIVSWEGPDDVVDAPPPVLLRLPTPQGRAAEEQQRQQHLAITALQWLAFPSFSALALGTSHGSVLFYSTSGDLLHAQIFQASPVLQLQARGSNSKSSQHSSVEELTVVYAKSLVRVDASDLQPLLHRCLQNAEGRSKKGKNNVDFSVHRLSHQVWNVSRNMGGNSTCVDGVITGVMAPPLLEHQSSQRYFCAITVGPDCALAAHRLSEDRSNSITNMIMKKIMPATVSTVTALAKIIWRSNDNEQISDYRPPEVKPQDFGRASLITCLKDQPRKGERIVLSPSGAMAAITDSLGRILLVDTQALVVIRLWKGYRDAYCFFLEVPTSSNLDAAASRSSYQIMRKHDLILCLAIHAPRRGVVEIWKLRDGPRLAIIKCEANCRVIQPVFQFRGSEHGTRNEEYTLAMVYILNGDSGQLSLISPQLE